MLTLIRQAELNEDEEEKQRWQIIEETGVGCQDPR
jgi:hypothetical protein